MSPGALQDVPLNKPNENSAVVRPDKPRRGVDPMNPISAQVVTGRAREGTTHFLEGLGAPLALPATDITVQGRTELSATLFSAAPEEWVRYLSTPRSKRYEEDIALGVRVEPRHGRVAFIAQTPASVWLSSLLSEALLTLRQQIANKPSVGVLLEQMLQHSAEFPVPLHVRWSQRVPSVTTREVSWTSNTCVSIVLQKQYVLAVRRALESSSLTTTAQMGIWWPLLSSVIGHMALPLDSVDPFLAKIDVVAMQLYVGLNALYSEFSEGCLRPNPGGDVLERIASTSTGIPRQDLGTRHPYFRMLHQVAFALRARSFEHYQVELRIAAREYLDQVYMRLNLSGAMPDTEPWRRAMPLHWKGPKLKTPDPIVGHFGLADQEDYEAWMKVRNPFKELGYTLIRQIGIGDYGRVYEAYNTGNAAFPENVALKVDRILGKKKRAILEAEKAIQVGRYLAAAPHLIRLFDGGKLQGHRFTYHVLQLVDGDTLDSLIGTLEMRHMSIGAPPPPQSSLAQVRREFARRLGFHQPKEWRRDRRGLSFRFGLSPIMLLDLLTSMSLCLNEVHSLGYAMNDIKNDNMMINHRGQVKGIDLDSFSVVSSPVDKYADFMFLAASVLLVVLYAPAPGGNYGVEWQRLLKDKKQLHAAVKAAWSTGVVETLSEGRVTAAELATVLVYLITRSRSLVYASDPQAFSKDISALVHIKRRMLPDDFVID